MAPQQQKKNEVGFLWTEDTARKLGVDPSTLFNWRRKNIGPQYPRRGGKVLSAIEDVEAYIRNSRVETQQ